MGEPAVENVEETEEIVEEVQGEITEETTEDTEGQEAEGGDEKPSVEAWLQEDDTEEPIKFPKSLKAKKRLKGVVEKQESELEKLRAENEALKNGASPKPTTLKRPDPNDFENDEDFDKALDDYYDARFEQRQKGKETEGQQKKIIESISKGVEKHYERAEKLIVDAGIEPEKYQTADKKLREAVSAVIPESGDVVVDLMLSRLGEGSEKVGYFIGNNDAARAEFQRLLKKDPDGFEAAMFLGAQKQRLNSPQKQKTKAKPPANSAEGDTNGSNAQERALKKKYKEAHSSGNTQAAFNIRREAKGLGFNPATW